MRTLYPFIALFISTTIYSQGSGVGFKLGGNLSYLSSEAVLENEYLFGANGGFFFPVLLRARMEIQPEVLFSMQGGGYRFPNSSTTSRLNYLAVPLPLKLYFNNWLNVEAGPQFSYLLYANTSINDTETEDATNDFATHDLSFLVGVGYAGRGGIDISIRYLIGMTTLLQEDEIIFPRNRVLQISVGYRFGQSRGRRR